MTDASHSRSSMGLRVYSHLLSSRENALLFNLLGPKCSAMALAVAQVYMAAVEPGGQGATWRCKDSGVVCLVKDRSLRSYFLRLYSITRPKLLWEQELYTPFGYSAPRPFFHTFPADDCQAGLNFANEEEAERFRSAVERRIKCAQDDSPSSRPQMTRARTMDSSSGLLFRVMLNKSDTGLPANRVTHESRDPEGGFDVNHLDPTLQKLFAKAGISQTDLKDEQISRILYSVFKRQGGLEAMQKQAQTSHPQTLPKCRGALSKLALKKGPLPSLPSLGTHKSLIPATPFTHDMIPPPPSFSAPTMAPGHPSLTQSTSFNLARSAQYKHGGSSFTAEPHSVNGTLRDATEKRHHLGLPSGDESNQFDED
ncbi:hypothetical protein AAFF_G00263540 [Aldrovandia affinis]|uniref:WH1 domain-containing protein n=1 Tax=Aldrovandia affinis TaxID=143900 RepID=A0AAD7SUM5_9TELE|nr:hypothetical protein AAFF_G00263540 [Aldrovandia affinis]